MRIRGWWAVPVLAAAAFGVAWVGGTTLRTRTSEPVAPAEPAVLEVGGAVRPPTASAPFSPSVLLRGRVPVASEAAVEPRRAAWDAIPLVPLPEARAWRAFLFAHWRGFRGQAAPPVDAERAALERALAEATSGVVRQNLIFLAALRLPPTVVEPWLEALRGGPDAEDAEDALVALAFSGEPSALVAFEALAAAPSAARVHRLVDRPADLDALAEGDEGPPRPILRSYRAIEVLDRRPYFKATPVKVNMRPWRAHPRYTPELARRLERAWLARYPGHPGSDDVALRIARRLEAEDEPYEAARWFLKASVLPDQDVTHGAVDAVIRLAERVLSLREVDALAADHEVGTFNRSLLQYLHLRRVASEIAFADAVAAAGAIAARETEGQIAFAWRARWSVPPSKALDSGLFPLAPDDPLRRRDGGFPLPADPFAAAATATQVGGAFARHAYHADDAARLDPPDAVLAPHSERFARQFRAWETLAELERRARRAQGAAHADLLYRQAAVYYHDPHVLFPAYAQVSVYHGWLFEDRWGSEEAGDLPPDAPTDYERRNYSGWRAIDLFDRIEHEHPGYAGMDRVVFSRAMARRKLSEFRPFRRPRQPHGESDRFDAMLRTAVEEFERVARTWPDSPLADDAGRAAAYWRRARPRAWSGR